MGTAPTGYQTPKTNWAAGNIPTAQDFNRIEGNVQAVEEGSRTIDPTQAPTSNIGTLRQLLDWFANRIKAITGKTNWYDAPDLTLADLKAHKSRHATNGPDPLTPGDIGAIQNAGATPSIMADIDANKPAAGVAGRIYIATDTKKIYRDDGTAWAQLPLDLPAGATIGGSTAWHAGNDGAGSGLDADTVDGIHGANFGRIASGSYVGDGASSRTITVGFTPKFVIVNTGVANGTDGHQISLRPSSGAWGIFAGQYVSAKFFATRNAPYQIPGITTNGFTVGYSADPSHLNYSGTTYYWVALG
ncbi:MAG: hypothetical protein H5U02_00235 [Clostridia bacterium]|nr:hypothetical protein [Clostridia bacterium]